MDLDYKRAWVELAVPAWNSLPANVRDAFCVAAWQLLGNDAKDWPTPASFQGEDHRKSVACYYACTDDEYARLSVKHAEIDLKTTLDEIPAEWLSKAAYIVDKLGHWFDPRTKDPEIVAARDALGAEVSGALRSGGHWRFRHMAHRSLSRLKGDYKMTKEWDLEPYDKTPSVVALRQLKAVPAPEGARVLDVHAINFKPHPFTVGVESFPTDGSMYIKDDAPCAHRWKGEPHSRCQLTAAEHKYDEVCVLQIPAVPKQDDVQSWVTALATLTASADFKARVDGFVFVKEE